MSGHYYAVHSVVTYVSGRTGAVRQATLYDDRVLTLAEVWDRMTALCGVRPESILDVINTPTVKGAKK